jgi:hypothetical protein
MEHMGVAEPLAPAENIFTVPCKSSAT